MALWQHRFRWLLLTALLCPLIAPLSLPAQTPTAQPPAAPAATPAVSMEERLRQLERSQAELTEKNRQLSLQVQQLQAASSDRPSAASPPPARGTSAFLPHPTESDDEVELRNASADGDAKSSGSDRTAPALTETRPSTEEESSAWRMPSSSSTYDDGLVFRLNSEEFPFELKINGQNQIRYTGFAREEETWTDSAGNVSTVPNRNAFELPRGRLIFTGHAFREELLYDLNIDYNTVSSSQINFRSYWLGWKFDRALTVYAGQNKVPGGREWLTSSTQALGPDRSMATTFFRPSLSQGIWATGEPEDGWFYHAMVSNGFNTLGSTPDELNSRMTFSGSTWIEPLGAFGHGYSDFEYHEQAAIRLGTSLTYARIEGPQGDPNAPENSQVRLSDGTVITETGALAPGVVLTNYDIALASFDFAIKHRGVSFSTEFYLQDLLHLQSTGPIPQSSIFQFGGFAQLGAFVVEKKLELYVRTSHVSGPFGSGAEYAGGFNWFMLPDKQNLKYTLDIANLDHSPADQNRTDFQAGQTGWLVRSQIQITY